MKRGVGRPRKQPGQGLVSRMYLRSGTFYYVHRENGCWENLGTDMVRARERAMIYNSNKPLRNSVAAWMVQWHKHLDEKVKRGELAARTCCDYKDNSKYLASFFGKMLPIDVTTQHVYRYLKLGREHGRAVRANREKAALSVFFTWLLSEGLAEVQINPCLKVRRNSESKRDRYADDDELAAVLKACGPAEGALSRIVYATLQRPNDILGWKWSSNVFEDADGVKRLRFRQGKTGAQMSILLTDDLLQVLNDLKNSRSVQSDYLIPREDGRSYTRMGISSMFRKVCARIGVSDLNIYDFKARGATDMYNSGVPLEEIRELCGHKSITTTEIYLKRRKVKDLKPAPLIQAMKV